MRNSYALLHPAAFAVSGGIGALILALLGGFAMMGAGSMSGGMMGAYGPYAGYPGYHMTVGAGFFMLIWAFVIGMVVGWIGAHVYNAIVRRSLETDTTTALSAR
jgi:hypothetical protein